MGESSPHRSLRVVVRLAVDPVPDSRRVRCLAKGHRFS